MRPKNGSEWNLRMRPKNGMRMRPKDGMRMRPINRVMSGGHEWPGNMAKGGEGANV